MAFPVSFRLGIAFVVLAACSGQHILRLERRAIFFAAYPFPRGVMDFLAVPSRPLARGDEPTELYCEPAAPGRRTLVWFHGNGQHAGDLGVADAFHRRGLGFCSPEYPGFGAGQPLEPNESASFEAGDRSLRTLRVEHGVRPRSVVLVGYSLGSGVAVELARRGRASKLVLLAPFTSIPGVVDAFLPGFDVREEVIDRFDNEARAPLVDVPVLILTGTLDTLTPVRMARTLAARFPHATLVEVPHADHNNVFYTPSVLERIANFASE